MIATLKRINSFFEKNPLVFYGALIVLTLLLIASTVLSFICPPAVLAVSIAGASLVGTLIPALAISLLAIFSLGAYLANAVAREAHSEHSEMASAYMINPLCGLGGVNVIELASTTPPNTVYTSPVGRRKEEIQNEAISTKTLGTLF
ncbi:MAG: hypothetical protein WC785_10425 [Tatlockia sp.]|jgi:hypothetical protein